MPSRIRTLGTRVPTQSLQRAPLAPSPSEQRITGRRLQARRLRVWAENPLCARCGQLTDFPHGFHLDHVVALVNGGEDTEANCQVLCVDCHDAKTADDLGHRARRT